MKKKIQNDNPSSQEPGYNSVLAEWVTTVATFRGRHDQIARLLKAYQLQQLSKVPGAGLGQSSVEELTDLMDRMQYELEVLLLDMGQSAKRTIPEKYQKLIIHTRQLEALSQEAQKLIILAILPPS